MDPSAAKLIGAGLASIALVGAGIGIGTIFGNYLQGALRNPSAAQGQFGTAAVAADGLNPFAGALLAEHNTERDRVGVRRGRGVGGIRDADEADDVLHALADTSPAAGDDPWDVHVDGLRLGSQRPGPRPPPPRLRVPKPERPGRGRAGLRPGPPVPCLP